MTRFQEFVMKFVVGAVALMLFSVVIGATITLIIAVVKIVVVVLLLMMGYELINKLFFQKNVS